MGEGSSVAAGEKGDREDFDGAGELRRDLEDNLSRTYYVDIDDITSQFRDMVETDESMEGSMKRGEREAYNDGVPAVGVT